MFEIIDPLGVNEPDPWDWFDAYDDGYDDWYEEECEFYATCVLCGNAGDDTVDGLCSECYEESEVNADRHALRRDGKRERAIHGMQVSGRSTKSVLLPVIEKRASQSRRKERHSARR